MNNTYYIDKCEGKNAPLCQRCRRRDPNANPRQIYIKPALTLNGCKNFIGYHSFDKMTKNNEREINGSR